jgi:hypothetical protein
MTVQSLLNEIRELQANELHLVAAELARLEGENVRRASSSSKTSLTTSAKESPVQWPDRAARRREIFGEAVFPNLVLEEREQSRW